MKSMLRTELHRAFTGIGFRISMGVGMLISMFHIVHFILPRAKGISEMLQYFKSDMQYPVSLYSEWMCGNTYNPEGFLYFLILPVLAVLPHSISFYQDKESGYIRQICTRTKCMSYLMAKSMSVFIVGGVAVTVPLLFNLLICAMFLPALPPQGLAGNAIYTAVLWYRVFAKYPLVYVGIFLGLDFLFGGFTACLPLYFSFYSEKKYVILLMPFVMQVFIYAVCMMSGGVNAVNYSPVYLFFAGSGCPSAVVLVIYLSVYGLIGGALFWRTGSREDIF